MDSRTLCESNCTVMARAFTQSVLQRCTIQAVQNAASCAVPPSGKGRKRHRPVVLLWWWWWLC